MIGRAQWRRLWGSLENFGFGHGSFPCTRCSTAGHTQVDVFRGPTVQKVGQNPLLAGFCQVQKGDWYLRVMQHMVHCDDGKTCIDQTS